MWDAERSLISRLALGEIPWLAEREVIRGGMLPKLEACRRALAGGVGRVQIVPAIGVESLSQVVAAKAQLGTEVVA